MEENAEIYMYLLLQMHRTPPIISCPKYLNVFIRLLTAFSIFCKLNVLTFTLESISYLLLFLLAFIDRIETSNPLPASKLDKTAVHLSVPPSFVISSIKRLLSLFYSFQSFTRSFSCISIFDRKLFFRQ